MKVAPFPPKEDISPLFSNRRQAEGRDCLQALLRCEGGRPKVKGGFRGNVNTSLLLLKHN